MGFLGFCRVFYGLLGLRAEGFGFCGFLSVNAESVMVLARGFYRPHSRRAPHGPTQTDWALPRGTILCHVQRERRLKGGNYLFRYKVKE